MLRYLAPLLLLLTSCYSKQQCIDKFCSETEVVVHDTINFHDTFYTEADTAFLSVFLDSLVYDSLTEVLNSRDMLIRFLRYKNNKLGVQAICKGDTIIQDTTIYREIKADCNCPEPLDEKELIERGKLKAYRNSFLVIAFLTFLFFYLYSRKKSG